MKDNRNKHIRYITSLWEGNDHKPSYRRVAQLIFMILIVRIVITGEVQTQWGFYTLIVLCTTFLLLAAIISGQQLVDCVKGLGAYTSMFSNPYGNISQSDPTQVAQPGVIEQAGQEIVS